MTKKIFGEHYHSFRIRGHRTPKMNITFFSPKLVNTYFHVKQFFQKKQYFLNKLQKSVLEAHLIGKGSVLRQKLMISFFVTN